MKVENLKLKIHVIEIKTETENYKIIELNVNWKLKIENY